MLSTGSERNKVSLPLIRRDGSVLTLSVLAFVLLVACGPDASTPQGTAERFLDAHYVRIALRDALPFTSGLARHKVEDELRLVEGQPIDAATRKPTVHYRLLETRPDRVIELAVAGMLPKNSIGRKLITKLKVYGGSEHPHAAQKPEPLDVPVIGERAAAAQPGRR